jgi:uncharacterized protein (DUF2249 family)
MNQLDLRTIQPRNRHALVFDTFDGLDAGDSFELLNDHAPIPLYYQFMHERTGLFAWESLEEGPETWRVQITRT